MFASILKFLPKSIALAAALLFGTTMVYEFTASMITEAKAESSRSGVILGGSKRYHHKRAYRAHRSTASSRLGYRKHGSLKYGKRHTGKHRRHAHSADSRYKRSDLPYIDRRRKIEAYNRSLRRERAGVVYGKPSYGKLVVYPYDRQGIVTSGYSDTGVAGPVITSTEPCPSHHNCGYRLYDDGTGPRIITPGVSAGKGLPQFDGLSGPRVITLSD